MARKNQDPDDQEGPLLAVMRQFLGQKDSSPRQSIGDNQFSILNNAMPTDDGNLQSIPGHSASLLNSGSGTYVSMRAVLRNNLTYVMIFLADGSAIEVPASDGGAGSPVTVGPAGTFSGGATVSTRQVYSSTCDWNNTITLIIDPTKGYFSWDGTTRTLLSSSVKGYTIASHQGRAVIGMGRNYTLTGTGGYNDLNTAHGFATQPLNGDAFIGDITLIRESISYLYIFCASGVGAIGTIQFTSGANYFQLQPLIAGTGTAPGTDVVDYDGLLFYTHRTGIYALTGPQPQYVSYDIRNTVSKASWGPLSGGSSYSQNGNCGLCYINGVRMPVFMASQNSGSGARAQFMFFPDALDENAAGGISAVGRWFTGDDIVSGTSLGIRAMCGITNDDGPWLYGISATDLYALFSATGKNLSTTIQTKFYDFGNAILNKDTTLIGVEGTFQNGTQITMTADSETASVGTGVTPLVAANTTNIQQLSGDAQNTGKYQGMTLTFTSNRWQISALLWEYQEGTTW